MQDWMAVGLGGAIGAVSRYGLGLWTRRWELAGWPTGTFLANVLGCLAIGWIASILLRAEGAKALLLQRFLVIGVLGGFTTFSSFGLETLGLLRAGRTLTALSYAGLSLLLGLLAVAIGLRIGGA